MLLQAWTPFPSRATWGVLSDGYWIRANTNLVLSSVGRGSVWTGVGLLRPPPWPTQTNSSKAHTQPVLAQPPPPARLIDNHCSSSLVPLIGFPSFGGKHSGETGDRGQRGAHVAACPRPAPSPPHRRLRNADAAILLVLEAAGVQSIHTVYKQQLAKLTATQLPLLSNFFLEINRKVHSL